MVRYWFSIFTLLLAIALIIGCSGGSENPIDPVNADDENIAQSSTGTIMAGLWQVIINSETAEVDIIQLRQAEGALNVIGFLEPPPLTGMSIDFADNFIVDAGSNIVEATVFLVHPLNDSAFIGFDVRGVVFGPEVSNADGYTPVMAPENFSGEPFGYQDGLLGVPNGTANYNDGIYGFKYFGKGVAKDEDLPTHFSDPAALAERGQFANGTTRYRRYELDWSDGDYPFLVFNYAIYANYDFPVGDPPYTIDDYPATAANCAEAFCIAVTEVSNSLYFSGGSGGGAISLDVEAWDWQGDIVEASIEAPGVIAKTTETTSVPGSTAYSEVFSFVAVPGTPTETGELPIIVTVVDAKTFGDAWFLNLLSPGNSMYSEPIYSAYVHNATVIECPESIYSTSFDSGDPESSEWQRDIPSYWQCGWFNGNINSNDAGCACYGAYAAANVWRTNGFDIPACWSGDPLLTIQDMFIMEGGTWDVYGYQYSVNNGPWTQLNFYDRPYTYYWNGFMWWNASGGGIIHANLTMVNPGDNIRIRAGMCGRDGIANCYQGVTLQSWVID